LSKGFKIFSEWIIRSDLFAASFVLMIIAVQIFLMFILIGMAFGAGFQSGRQVSCGGAYYSDNATMSDISRLERHDDSLDSLGRFDDAHDEDDLDGVVAGANRMLTG
jgi:hypothetical protein